MEPFDPAVPAPDPELIDVEAFARQNEYIADRTVALRWPTPEGDEEFGSGVCIQLGGRLFLITAGHNLRDIEHRGQLRIYLPVPTEAPTLPLAWNRSTDCDGLPDVGWIELPSAVLGQGRLAALSFQDLAFDAKHDPTRAFWCHGYPSEAIEYNSQGGLNLTSCGVITSSHPPADERHKDAAEGTLILEYPPRDYPGEFPDPRGMSGGGFWTIPRYDEFAEWRPDRAKFAAIGRRWHPDDGEIRATPVRKWVEFIFQDIPDLRCEVPNQVSSR